MENYCLQKHSVKYQARFWAATLPIRTEWQEEYVTENAGLTNTYTTPASDNDVIIRWGYPEDKDKNYQGRHVHVWMAVMNGDTGVKKRITKHAAHQRLTSALRMCEYENIDIPYLAPLSNRLSYERYMDKANVNDEDSWKNGGITNVNYLRRVVNEVGTDLFKIFNKIHDDTRLPLQKIVSQRAGITAYLDMQKTVKTGSIKRHEQQANQHGVNSVIRCI